jgi:uncharacterized protein (DUF2384 family)
MLAAFLDDVVDRGVISPSRMSERLHMPLSRLAAVAGLHRNTLAHPGSAKVQEKLGMIAKIIAKAAALAGDPGRAVIWFRYQPIAGFDDKTAEDLVAAGHGEAVLLHLEDLADGVHA